MDKILLEQGVLLAVGWQRRTALFSEGKMDMSSADMPREVTLSPKAFLDLQARLAQEACGWWQAQVNLSMRFLEDREQQLSKMRLELPGRIGRGEISAAKANEEAGLIVEQLELVRNEMETCTTLLECLRGSAPSLLPTLPLCRYAESHRQLRDAWNIRQTENESMPVAGSAPAGIHFFLRAIRSGMKSLDRADRLAIVMALLFSCIIGVAGLFYAYRSGAVSFSFDPLGGRSYRVTCENAGKQPVLIHIPYDGLGLQNDGQSRLGVWVEAFDKEGKKLAGPPLETLWTYRDQPAHLHGPILVSALSRETFTLKIAGDITGNSIHRLRISLFRPTNRKYRSYEIPVSPDTE